MKVNLPLIFLGIRQIPFQSITIPINNNYKITNDGVLFLDICIENIESKIVLDPSHPLENELIIKIDNLKWNAFDNRYGRGNDDNSHRSNKADNKDNNGTSSLIHKNEDSCKELINISVKLNRGKMRIVNQDEINEDKIQIVIKVYSITFIMLLKCIKEIVLFFEQSLACLKENLLEVSTIYALIIFKCIHI